ncbi:ATP-binding cassette domain-containing protein [Lutibacter citreus]|uniref:ATP-binding cassette domain-containing protein n=1 Tax=Lutibacter citreus TaxID=2138210 RepID=UPI000DBE469C|nr:ATP-binding cassette domain-containing protein [Lutibacter citreus]
MKQKKHCAIYGSNIKIESLFLKNLLKGNAPEPFKHLAGKTGVLFSSHNLNKFIKEEEIHSDFTLSKGTTRSIRTFSSGEQKKALLNHLLLKHPDFIVLDNAFDMLDTEAQKDLSLRLYELSKKLIIIQIFRRKERVLSFIENVVKIENDTIVYSGSISNYENEYKVEKTFNINGTIPPPLNQIDSINNPLIHFKNVTVKYGDKTIVNNINWEIKKGDFWQLKGPNGSGKTTLLTMITGDNPKAFGQDITLFGRKKGTGESVWEIKKKIGYVTPAMTVLFEGRHTVESMVISGLHDSIGLYKSPKSMETALANKWIDLIGLTNLKQAWFSDISEQQQCMVLIARSMIKHPPLLILDEPTHGLDDYNVLVLTTLINKISKESKTAIIYVSHKKEKGLNPKVTYELIPTKEGSIGKTLTDN